MNRAQRMDKTQHTSLNTFTTSPFADIKIPDQVLKNTKFDELTSISPIQNTKWNTVKKKCDRIFRRIIGLPSVYYKTHRSPDGIKVYVLHISLGWQSYFREKKQKSENTLKNL